MLSFRHHLLALSLLAITFSCGTSNHSPTADPASSRDPCGDCNPTEPDSKDFRYAEKHVPLPSGTPQDITVATMLSWPDKPYPTDTSPRTGRELQLFRIPHGYLQAIWKQPTDCDIHMEISDTPDKSAPRIIIETPRDEEYCSMRLQELNLFTQHGLQLKETQQEVPVPFVVSAIGLAFEDFEHDRGSKHVASLWELHPAVLQFQ